MSNEDTKEDDVEEYQKNDPNCYRNYGISFEDYQDEGIKNFKGKPAHKYTIEIHRAMYGEEMFQLYLRYEKAVHKRDRDKSNIINFLCNSPLFDPRNEPRKANHPTPLAMKSIDKVHHEFKDEGVYP